MRRHFLYGILGATGLAALVAARPIAASGVFGGHRFGGWGHHRMNPEAIREHLDVGVKWALRDVNATEEQQQKISAIAGGALTEITSLRDRHLANKEALHAQLSGASIDRGELEKIRQSQLALADEASRTLVAALADAAAVLTPEQRKALAEKHAARHRGE
jgi:Spy/CpxP family protein refolding chaperone